MLGQLEVFNNKPLHVVLFSSIREKSILAHIPGKGLSKKTKNKKRKTQHIPYFFKMSNKEERLLTYEEVKDRLDKYKKKGKSTGIETIRYVIQSVLCKPHAPLSLKEKLLGFGITEFEAVQLLNNPPMKILDLYVIVEELEERLSEKEIGEILYILSSYAS